MKTYIVFHSNCYDGFTAAWIAKNYFATRQDVVMLPFNYGDTAPEINIGDEVYILDASYPRDILRGLNFLAKKCVVLDHHKTAQANCEGLDFCIFDMDRSGAGLTWDYFYPNKVRPRLVDYTEDRDLWRFKLPHSREIFEWVASYPMKLVTWDALNYQLEHEEDGFMDAVREGTAILRYTEQKVEQVVGNPIITEIAGYTVPVVNVPASMGSDSCHRLLELRPEAPFAAYYFINAKGEQVWGVRGRDSDDFDVSEVAKQFGGGGHKKAAGFRIKIEVEQDDSVTKVDVRSGEA